MYLSVSTQTYRKQENAGSCIIVQTAKTTGFQFTGLLKIQSLAIFFFFYSQDPASSDRHKN